jgi:hypothetical protein
MVAKLPFGAQIVNKRRKLGDSFALFQVEYVLVKLVLFAQAPDTFLPKRGLPIVKQLLETRLGKSFVSMASAW